VVIPSLRIWLAADVRTQKKREFIADKKNVAYELIAENTASPDIS
jgi:hypothetical protein